MNLLRTNIWLDFAEREKNCVWQKKNRTECFLSTNKQMNINAITGKCLSNESKHFINVKQLNKSLCSANQVQKFKRIFVETINSLCFIGEPKHQDRKWVREICLIFGQISLLILEMPFKICERHIVCTAMGITQLSIHSWCATMNIDLAGANLA